MKESVTFVILSLVRCNSKSTLGIQMQFINLQKKFPISRTLLGLPVYQSKKLFQNLFPHWFRPPPCLLIFKNSDTRPFPPFINGRRIYGGVQPLYDLFLFLTLLFKIRKRFLPVLSKLSQATMVKKFYFSDPWKVVSVAPQRGGEHPPP